MICQHCVSGLQHSYNFKCVQCCARLIKHARPSKERQESQLGIISKLCAESPSREAILEALKGMT